MSFIALVKCPLFDSLGTQKARLRQDLEVLTHGRLGDPQLLGNQYAADAVLHHVAVDLSAKMLSWVLQPLQDQSTPIIRERPQSGIDVVFVLDHIGN